MVSNSSQLRAGLQQSSQRINNLTRSSSQRFQDINQRLQRDKQIAQYNQEVKQEAQRLDTEFSKAKGNINEIVNSYNNLPKDIQQNMSFTPQVLQQSQTQLKTDIQKRIENAERRIDRGRQRERREKDRDNPNARTIDRIIADENRYRAEIKAYNEAIREVDKGNLLDMNNVNQFARDSGRNEFNSSVGSYLQSQARKDLADQLKSGVGNVTSINYKTGRVIVDGQTLTLNPRDIKGLQLTKTDRTLQSQAGKGLTVGELRTQGYSMAEISRIGEFESQLLQQQVKKDPIAFDVKKFTFLKPSTIDAISNVADKQVVRRQVDTISTSIGLNKLPKQASDDILNQRIKLLEDIQKADTRNEKKIISNNIKETLQIANNLNLNKDTTTGLVNNIVSNKPLTESQQKEFWSKFALSGVKNIPKFVSSGLKLTTSPIVSAFDYGKNLVVRAKKGENPLSNDLSKLKKTPQFAKKVGIGAVKEVTDLVNFIYGIQGVTVDTKGKSYDGVVASGARPLFNYSFNVIKAYKQGVGTQKLKSDLKSATSKVINFPKNTFDFSKQGIKFAKENPILLNMVVAGAISAGVISSKDAFLKNPEENTGRAIVWLFPGTIITTATKGTKAVTRITPKVLNELKSNAKAISTQVKNASSINLKRLDDYIKSLKELKKAEISNSISPQVLQGKELTKAQATFKSLESQYNLNVVLSKPSSQINRKTVLQSLTDVKILSAKPITKPNPITSSSVVPTANNFQKYLNSIEDKKVLRKALIETRALGFNVVKKKLDTPILNIKTGDIIRTQWIVKTKTSKPRKSKGRKLKKQIKKEKTKKLSESQLKKQLKDRNFKKIKETQNEWKNIIKEFDKDFKNILNADLKKEKRLFQKMGTKAQVSTLQLKSVTKKNNDNIKSNYKKKIRKHNLKLRSRKTKIKNHKKKINKKQELNNLIKESKRFSKDLRKEIKDIEVNIKFYKKVIKISPVISKALLPFLKDLIKFKSELLKDLNLNNAQIKKLEDLGKLIPKLDNTQLKAIDINLGKIFDFKSVQDLSSFNLNIKTTKPIIPRVPKIPKTPKIIPRVPKTPRKPRLPIPSIELKAKSRRIGLYEAKYRERRDRKKHFNPKTNPIIVKTLRIRDTPNRVYKKVMDLADITAVRSIEIKKVGTTNKIKKDISKPKVVKKFDKKKPKSNVLRFVEKSKFAMDNKAERKDIKLSRKKKPKKDVKKPKKVKSAKKIKKKPSKTSKKKKK